MYVPDGWGSVYAIDMTAGKKGTIKWKMDPGTDRAWAGDVACCGVNNRGVALWKDKVISIALDGRMFAINKATGERGVGAQDRRARASARRSRSRRWSSAMSRSSAPPAASSASAASSRRPTSTPARQAWRTYTIPGTGEPGNETWKDGKERWKHGGGSIWETATYDPDTDTFYQGIGNAGPDYDIRVSPGRQQVGGERARASLPTTARSSGASSTRRNDPYDFDEISEHPIINAKVNGEDRKLVVHAARNGFFYALDRTNGSFIIGKQYVGRAELDARPRSEDRPAAQLRSQQATCRSTRRAATACAASRRRRTLPVERRRQELGAVGLQSRARAAVSSRRSRAATPSRPSSRRTSSTRAAPSKPRERFTGGGTKTVRAALRQPQGDRSGDRRDQGHLEARLSELRRRARDRRQPRLHRRSRTAPSRPTTPRP